MFEIIGIIVVWLLGLWLMWAIPILYVAINEKKLGEKTISAMIMAYWISVGLSISYVLSTIVYLAMT